MAFDQWWGQTLTVSDLDGKYFVHVDGSDEARDRGPQVRIPVWCYTGWERRISIDPGRNVECVEANPEVRQVDLRDNFPALIPGVDMVAPCQ